MAKHAPPGWGDDSLSEFLELSQKNRWATFASGKPVVEKLISIDACFMRSQGHIVPASQLVASMLGVRSHSAFRAACEHAMAGQVAETFTDVRAALEYAGYARLIGERMDIAEIWLRRHDSTADESAMKKAFSAAQVKAEIKRCNRKAAEVYETLYQLSIDYGAHPNERSATASLRIGDRGERQEFQQLQLHADGPQLDFALITTARAGVCALEILQTIFSARFELLGISASLLDIRRGL
jgi:hypothetical protein